MSFSTSNLEAYYTGAIGDTPTNLRLDPDSIPDEVWVTRFLPARQHDGYMRYPILPDIGAGRWLAKTALAPLFADNTTPASRIIEVAQMPNDLCAAMNAYPRDAFGPDGIGNNAEHMRVIQDAALRIGDKFIRVTRAPARGLTTTTVPLTANHPDRGKKTGPHIDIQGVDKNGHLPIMQRLESPRRLIGNAGPGGKRITFFSPTDVITLAGMTCILEGYEDDPYFMFHDWHRDHPDSLLCIGIPTEPGQALLINTDACLHDGSTIFCTEESLCVQIIGRWRRGSLAKAA